MVVKFSLYLAILKPQAEKTLRVTVFPLLPSKPTKSFSYRDLQNTARDSPSDQRKNSLPVGRQAV